MADDRGAEGNGEAATTQRQLSRWARLRQRVRDGLVVNAGMLAYAVFIFVLIAFAGMATVEIATRAKHLSFVTSELASINNQLATKSDQDPERAGLNEQRISFLDSLSRIQKLASVGALEYCNTTQGIVEFPLLKECRAIKTERFTSLGLLERISIVIGSWSDESIFLVLAVCCGAIGALVGGLRTDDFTLFRDLALGFASGFVVYLAIKGGKHVFLLSATGNENQILLNPYAYAFSGILVGLFTEKAYNLLSALMEELDHRLRGVVTTARSPVKPPEEESAVKPI